LKEICKGTYGEEIGMFLASVWKEEDFSAGKKGKKKNPLGFIYHLAFRKAEILNNYL